jgi:ribosomal protein L33
MTNPKLTKEQKLEIERFCKTIPLLWRETYRRTLLDPRGKAMRIKLKCQECVGFENVASRVRTCQVITCANWIVRPYLKAIEQDRDVIENE